MFPDIEDQDLIRYLIDSGESVEYGEPWTETTTHEHYTAKDGRLRARMVQTYHGGGNRGDDDQAEYVRRLVAMGRAIPADKVDRLALRAGWLPEDPAVTHIIEDGRAIRIRYYMPAPKEMI